MSQYAYLPCFKCNKVMQNVFEDADNQPYEGTVFRTEGHYGSTFWDSFDGEELVLNICDACLRAHTERLGQQKVYMPVKCNGMTGFGRVTVERPLVAYTGNPDDTVFNVHIEDLGANAEELEVESIEWVNDIAERKAELQATGDSAIDHPQLF